LRSSQRRKPAIRSASVDRNASASVIEKVAEEIGRLEKCAAVELVFSKRALASPKEQIGENDEVIKRMYGLDCASSVLQSLTIDDELSAYWKSKGRPASETVVGEFFLRSVLLFAASSGLPETYLNRDYDFVKLAETRVFDYSPYQGGPIYSLLPVINNRIDDRVYIFNEKKVYKTSLNYLSYVGALRRTRGFLLWQYLFCVGIELDEFELLEMRKGLDFVAGMFDEDDYTDLRTLLNERST
jgi:hypothetical protein